MQEVQDYLPLKLNSAGVMPIIFGQALMFVPNYLAQSTDGAVQEFFKVLRIIWMGIQYCVLYHQLSCSVISILRLLFVQMKWRTD